MHLAAGLILGPGMLSGLAVTLHTLDMTGLCSLIVFAVFGFHMAWIVFSGFLVKAEENYDKQFFLPFNFKQVLYLDVFGNIFGDGEESAEKDKQVLWDVKTKNK